MIHTTGQVIREICEICGQNLHPKLQLIGIMFHSRPSGVDGDGAVVDETIGGGEGVGGEGLGGEGLGLVGGRRLIGIRVAGDENRSSHH